MICLQKLPLCCHWQPPPFPACACTHTPPCQPFVSGWQLFLKSCLLFSLPLSCPCSRASLPFPGKELCHHLKLFCFLSHPTSIPIACSSCPSISKGSLCCLQPISLICSHLPLALPFQQRLVWQQPLSCRRLQTSPLFVCVLSLRGTHTVRAPAVPFLQLFSSCGKVQAGASVKPPLLAKMVGRDQKQNFGALWGNGHPRLK